MNDDNRSTDTPPPAQREKARKKAQDHFAAAEKRDTEVRKELERERAAAMAQMAKLRALRLAKEEAERNTDDAQAPAPVRPAKPRRIKV
jgi:hypothetical protein